MYNKKVSGSALASPFEERLPPLRGKMSRSDKRGSVASRSDDGEGADPQMCYRCATLSQKAALQLPFSSTTLPVKMRFRADRSLPGSAQL